MTRGLLDFLRRVLPLLVDLIGVLVVGLFPLLVEVVEEASVEKVQGHDEGLQEVPTREVLQPL